MIINHAKYAPSSMDMLIACPGSNTMRANYPQEDSESAREGTAAHEVAAQLVLDGTLLEVGASASDGITVISEEMIEGAYIWADALDDLVGREGVCSGQVERTVPCNVIDSECWGTPDFYHAHGDMLTVADYKFGHRYVEVFENWQLLTYAAGIIASHNISPTTIQLIIVQPRSYHQDGPVRVWSFLASELPKYVTLLRRAVTAAQSPDAQCVPNPNCGDCTARWACRALQSASLAALDRTYDAIPLELTPDAVATELRMFMRARQMIEARIDGLTEHAEHLIKNGVSLDGFTMRAFPGRDRWKVSMDEAVALGEMFGINIAKPGILTPKQAIKAGLPTDVVGQYTETASGKLKLVESTNIALRKIFS